MVVKQITVFVKPGHMAEYVESQRKWNRLTRQCRGCVGEFIGQAPGDENTVHVFVYWESRAHLDRFMAEDHDRIAAEAGADRHYERIEVRILDEVH